MMVDGNRLRLLSGGPERFAALMALIDGAQSQLSLCFYIFADDGHATEVRGALIAACGRGVAVTLLVDAFGSASTPPAFWSPLIDSGATFARFSARRSTRYLIRNHQKMIIADGARVMIGGFNVEATYFADDRNSDGWCDLGLMVDGPAAAGLQKWFDRLARWTLDDRQRFRALGRMVREWDAGEGALRWLVGGPTRGTSGWTRAVRHDMATARRIDIIAAYFSPARSMISRIGRIARRGGARILVPQKSDNMVTVGAARHLYVRLIRLGVGLYEFQPAKLHMKCIIMDDVVYIGSANFDLRSMFLNVEIMLRVEDAGFAAAMRTLFADMVARSVPIDRAQYRSMAGPVARLRWWLSYLLVGVLDYTVTRRLNFRSEGGAGPP